MKIVYHVQFLRQLAATDGGQEQAVTEGEQKHLVMYLIKKEKKRPETGKKLILLESLTSTNYEFYTNQPKYVSAPSDQCTFTKI